LNKYKDNNVSIELPIEITDFFRKKSLEFENLDDKIKYISKPKKFNSFKQTKSNEIFSKLIWVRIFNNTMLYDIDTKNYFIDFTVIHPHFARNFFEFELKFDLVEAIYKLGHNDTYIKKLNKNDDFKSFDLLQYD